MDTKVNTLFETHIAAKFLGILETGLAPLLKNRLGIVVDKTYQKKDWSKRPLSLPMLAYAVHIPVISSPFSEDSTENEIFLSRSRKAEIITTVIHWSISRIIISA